MLNQFISLTFIFIFVFNPREARAQQAASISEGFTNSVFWKGKIEGEVLDRTGELFVDWSDEFLAIDHNYFQNHVHIQGKFKQNVAKVILTSEQGSQELEVHGRSLDFNLVFHDEGNEFRLTATDSNGVVHLMHYRIVQLGGVENGVKHIDRWRFMLGAGGTVLSFRQQNVVPFNEDALTLKGGFTYRLAPDLWDLGVSSFFNALAFDSKSVAGYKIQYLGVNVRIGYHLIRAPSALRININTGIYYNTSLSTVGFLDMYGPQLYPEVIYIFPNGHSLLLYAKYSPAISPHHDFFTNSNREVATGMHYSFPISPTNGMSVGVDVSQLNLSVVSQDGNWASTNTYSLSTGISF